MDKKAPWSPFLVTPEEMDMPRAKLPQACPDCPSRILPGDRVRPFYHPARGGRKYRGAKRWRHVTCPT